LKEQKILLISHSIFDYLDIFLDNLFIVGQKTHPIAFRLATSQSYLSRWYGQNVDYARFLQEDFAIRQLTEKEVGKILEISSLQIERVGEKVNLLLTTLYPREQALIEVVNESFRGQLETISKKKYSAKELASIFLKFKLRRLSQKLSKFSGDTYVISLKLIKNRYHDASLIASFLSSQLNDRVPFRRVMKTALGKAMKGGAKGIKIELSGRLNGIDIARSEWKREGKIPLHTLQAPIDYSQKTSKGPQGITGVKVWLYL
jgi:small subunit ribosomal protein S3